VIQDIWAKNFKNFFKWTKIQLQFSKSGVFLLNKYDHMIKGSREKKKRKEKEKRRKKKRKREKNKQTKKRETEKQK